MFNKLKTLPH